MAECWILRLPCTRAEAEALNDHDVPALALLDSQPSVVTQELEAFNPDKWEAIFYFDGKPSQDTQDIVRSILPGRDVTLEALPSADWVTLSQQAIAPVRAGRFFIHTATNADRIPSDVVPFRIEASRAFGTGGHETTSGCLAMLDWLKRTGRRFDHIADIGTGTGLLAFAALELWPRAYATATDIDPASIEVARENARQNGVLEGQGQGRVGLFVASGTAHEAIQRRAPYGLLIANILAGPLIELAAAFAAIVQPGGAIILAGLLDTQMKDVFRTYRRAGFRLLKSSQNGDWPCLCLVKRQRLGWRRPARADQMTSQPVGDFGTW